ncbi:hypothetical protein GCM10020220_063200 [Nonomuraea rubra]|uniref:hypothetical protein n=1 Tax=Nonomuraea rubra TaxID=46180 RepID=UPI0031EE0410
MIDGKKTATCAGTRTNATMSIGDSSVELVKDATTKQWRPKRDDGTRTRALNRRHER